MRLLIVCPYPIGKAPSQRFRFEQYIDHLEEQGIAVDCAPFWKDKEWPGIYQSGRVGFKVLSTFLGFLRRVGLLFTVRGYDKILIHREATPVGPPWWEWIAAKIFGKPIVYDFDDAVWLPNTSEVNKKWVAKLKFHDKTAKIIGWSRTVMAGNEFLAAYASRFCANVHVVPTTIDAESHHNRERHTRTNEGFEKGESNHFCTVGWTGTHSTLRQLVPVFPLLEQVHRHIPFRFLLISDRPPDSAPDFVEFRRWNKDSEIEDLMEMDIGVMPLFDSEWEWGKCGFKALQYMALGIPAVVSAVGANTDIVRDGIEGYWAEIMSTSEGTIWMDRLSKLLLDSGLRTKMGIAGRKRVVDHYSVEAHKNTYTKVLGENSKLN